MRMGFAVILFTSSVFAQAPGWSRGQQLLEISYDECVRRAPLVLQAEGYRIDYAQGAFAVGIKGIHTAVITCNAAPQAKMWVNVIVASNGEGGGTERQQLQGQMERATPVTRGGTDGTPARAGRYLTVRVNGRRAIVQWANAPTAQGSWVSIVPAGTGDGAHVGRWVYTEQKSSGTFENGPLEPGAYEARFYADGGYGQIVDRVAFHVAQDAVSSRMLNVQVNGRSAVVTWSNAPTDHGSWVSVVPAGAGDGTHVGKWVYTNQTASGRYEAGALAPGEYEARFYGDGGYGKLLERVKFRVD